MATTFTTALRNTSADAVQRETAWLREIGDTLPALLEEAGGPFEIVQAYWPRTPEASKRGLYVMRQRIRTVRFAAQRQMNKYPFLLRIVWPAFDGDGCVENDQGALDEAVELVLQRIGGLQFDKTHGGRFLSVAEGGEEQSVTFDDPARSLAESGCLTASIAYTADDVETIG